MREPLFSVALHFFPGELKVEEARHNMSIEEARQYITQHGDRAHVQVVRSQTIYIGPASNIDMDDIA